MSQMPAAARVANRLMAEALRRVPASSFKEGAPVLRVVGVRGRRSARMLQIPLGVIQVDGRPHLVSPESERNWVRNLDASGVCVVAGGGAEDCWSARRLEPEASVAVLRAYVGSTPGRVRSMFAFDSEASNREILEAAPRHAVFELYQA